jgi:hypothetical protein
MNTTKRTITILLVSGLLLAVGCQQRVAPKGKDADEASGRAGPAPSERANFPGGCLIVAIDNKQTQESKKESNEQIWSGGEISGTPTLLFAMDEDVLGAWKTVSLVIQPIQDGKVIEGDIYQYSGEQKLTPGQAIPLNAFTHVKDNKLQTGVKALPPGAYRIGLQVHGAKHWDRQRIDVQVKK